MESTTIDNLSIQTHKRWAQDQELTDPAFLKECGQVSPMTEVTSTSSIFASQWAALFGLDLRYLPWAGFTPPARFNTQAKRFFSYRIIPSLKFPEDPQDHEKGEEREKKERLKAFLERQKGAKTDKEILTDLVNTLFSLDDLLGKILVKKLQYHKG